MKIIKYIFLLFLLLALTISVFVATKDGTYTVTESTLIDVPLHTVFQYASDSKNFDSFNPWKGENSVINFENSFEKDSIILNFKESEDIKKFTLTFKDTLANKTFVSWSTKGKTGFRDKLLAIIGKGTKNNLSEMFTNGLATLKNILTSEINEYSTKIDGIVERDTLFYIQKPIACKTAELPAKIKLYLPQLQELLKTTNTATNGAPFIVYHAKDTIQDKITFSLAIPTQRKIYTSPDSDIFTGQINPYRAVKATLIGNYNHKNKTFAKIKEYLESNRLEQNEKFREIEVIPHNSLSDKSAAKWVTEIIIPVRSKKLTISVRPAKKDSLNTYIDSYFKPKEETNTNN